MGDMSIREFQRRFKNGDFKDSDFSVQCEAGWYDWFCSDKSLASRLVKLGNAVLKLEHKGKVDLDKQYVFFKNNCPMDGGLYDDFRICDIETGDVRYTISYRYPHRKNKFPWELYAICEGLNEEGHWNEYSFKNSSQLAKWLNSEGV